MPLVTLLTITESNLMLQMQILTTTRHDLCHVQEFYTEEITLPSQDLNVSCSIRVDCGLFLRIVFRLRKVPKLMQTSD
jgi:hypothetical protein